MRKSLLILMILGLILSVPALALFDKEYFPSLIVMGTNGTCKAGGSCYLNNLVVNNLSVTGSYFNVSVVNYNVTGDMGISGSLHLLGNLTATWFKGIFDWIIKPGISTSYLQFNGTDLSFNETKLNSTIDLRAPVSIHPFNATDQVYIYNSTNTIYFNETKLNNTIDNKIASASSGHTEFKFSNNKFMIKVT